MLINNFYINYIVVIYYCCNSATGFMLMNFFEDFLDASGLSSFTYNSMDPIPIMNALVLLQHLIM